MSKPKKSKAGLKTALEAALARSNGLRDPQSSPPAIISPLPSASLPLTQSVDNPAQALASCSLNDKSTPAPVNNAARLEFVSLATGVPSLVTEQQPSGVRVDVLGSVVRSFGPATAEQLKAWAEAGTPASCWLFRPEEEAMLSSIEAFLGGNIGKIVQKLNNRTQILVAHRSSPTGGVVLCAGGEFHSTPDGFRRFRVKVVGDQVAIEEL